MMKKINSMNTLILYDTQHNNTKEIAVSISQEFPSSFNVKISSVDDIKLEELKDVKLLIVGSPTHGGTAKQSLLMFLKTIPDNYLEGKYVVAFDTRFDEKKLKLPLKLLVKTIGYAASKIAKILESKGGTILIQPEGFFVEDTKGPLTNGEKERAKHWSKDISKIYLDFKKK